MRLPVGEDVEIFIPSRSRFERSKTLEALQLGGVADRAVLVVPYAQGVDYLPLAKRHKVKQVLRCKEDGIANTRRSIGERAQDKFLMLDDDLRFDRRNIADKKDLKLYAFGAHDMSAMLILLSRCLDHFKHCAISAREGNNHFPVPYITNSRPLRALAYHKAQFMQCEHGRVPIMEDFDVTLQLMAMGFSNCVITEFTQDQARTQLPGGCSDYRTKQLQAKGARTLAALHPDFVKLRTKDDNNQGGNFGKRLEVTVSWKKAHTTATEELL